MIISSIEHCEVNKILLIYYFINKDIFTIDKGEKNDIVFNNS